MTYASALQLKLSERAPKPTLEKALENFQQAVDRKVARRRRKDGFHQSYLSRATPETIRIGKRMQGERDE